MTNQQDELEVLLRSYIQNTVDALGRWLATLDKTTAERTIEAEVKKAITTTKGFINKAVQEALEKVEQEVVGEDDKPDVQLTSTKYLYSGEAEGRNQLRSNQRKALAKVKEEYGGKK